MRSFVVSPRSVHHRVPWLAFALLGTCVVLLLLGCIFVFPSYLVGRDLGRLPSSGLDAAARLKAVNDVRTTLLQGLAGAFFLATAFFTWRQIRISQRQLQLSEDQQIADRFSRAVEQLTKRLDLRLGGIYGLEQIAAASPVYGSVAVEILAAYIREHAPLPVTVSEGGLPEVSEDVQAALTVLGRSIGRHVTSERSINLCSVSLCKADLRGAVLPRVNLNGSILEKARLEDAQLPNAMLIGANMEAAHLDRTDISGGKLINAHLERAILDGTVLRGADLTGALVDRRTRVYNTHVEGAKLRHVALEDTRRNYLVGDDKTEWPEGFEQTPPRLPPLTAGR